MSVKPSKRYKEGSKLVDKAKTYMLKDAVAVLKSLPKTKFDESVELAIHLNIDVKKSDHMVRGTVVLPHGTGKKVRIAVFCKGDAEKDAKEAGADYIGAQDLIDKVTGGWMDFDCVVATPDMMRDLSKLGKVLGPRGLMPSPKTGTVTTNVAGAIKDLRAGKVEFKADKQGGVHVAVGKISFTEAQILENALTLIEALNSTRPASLKGDFISSIYICTSMGQGLRLNA
ncbi:MAG: 50S ribosomal protein L1 [Candidatus Omnitrophica bacterium CG1_02_44_16]|nr:MAG: 50S ribosomal protein L1 [Candidatus Omnitrophica bacterium CG1_02_44_16]PIY83834.1 MAG: 50S ribosomal protein L1 [Candidatus Omnitrophica bacterium CG_4_10_14_0_8_um_filter_44_12]PIZ85067.1 MAG: 50S ribosomal protein L1 [Candidatus Omnitrophica bacterium CG_4_10_14_0_2_um_filter_44_9]